VVREVEVNILYILMRDYTAAILLTAMGDNGGGEGGGKDRCS